VNQGDEKTLLLSDKHVAAELASLMPSEDFVHRADAYDALEELARRGYRAVILTHPYPEFAALVQAIRRLQPAAATFAMCSPGGEADLRLLGLKELDDYFIYPPSRAELERALHPGRPGVPPAGPAAERADLAPQEIVQLVEAANSVADLAEQVQRLVGKWTGLNVRWAGANEDPGGGEELLLLDGDPPSVLVTDKPGQLAPGLRRKLQTLQILLGPVAGQARRTETLHRLAITDYLTGAYNRRYFYRFTDQLLGRAQSERSRVTLLLFDIDDFKRYNDAYGHAAGDQILREATALMRQVTREHDIVARIGGDEFAVLFWDAEPPRRPDSQHPQEAFALAGRFVDALAKHAFDSLGPEAKGVLTISGGLATFPWDGNTCRELLRHADGALRQAKESGKNAIYLVGQGPINQAPQE